MSTLKPSLVTNVGVDSATRGTGATDPTTGEPTDRNRPPQPTPRTDTSTRIESRLIRGTDRARDQLADSGRL